MTATKAAWQFLGRPVQIIEPGDNVSLQDWIDRKMAIDKMDIKENAIAMSRINNMPAVTSQQDAAETALGFIFESCRVADDIVWNANVIDMLSRINNMFDKHLLEMADTLLEAAKANIDQNRNGEPK